MSLTMPPKKKTADKPKEPHRNPRESFHAPAELFEALDRYRNDQRIRPPKSVVMRVALENFLESVGYWPPPAKP